MDFAYTAFLGFARATLHAELPISLLQSPSCAYDVKLSSEMRIVQLRKSRLFRLVIAALLLVPLIYILFLHSSHEDIKFSAFSSKKVKTVSLFCLIQSLSFSKVFWFLNLLSKSTTYCRIPYWLIKFCSGREILCERSYCPALTVIMLHNRLHHFCIFNV